MSQLEAINFSMGIDAMKRWNRIGFYSSISPIEKLTASGYDETETIYVTGFGINGLIAGLVKIDFFPEKASTKFQYCLREI